jgi:UDP-GlcNAc:undecaprenyl-phosphate/decaprenyl-phosphate GlcNAc-1-phosphate transferase
MLSTVLTVSTAFFLSLFLTPLMVSLSKKLNIYDMPNGRKSHTVPTPLLGGIAIYLATVIAIVLFAQTTGTYTIPILIIGASGVSFMGLIDDIISLSAKRRMIILFIIALIVFFGCIQLYFSAMMMLRDIFIQVLFSIFIIIWMVGITNAINFMDGLDGLASYLSLISAVAFAIIFCLQERYTFILTITLSLAGGIAGFMPYNRNPAMLFMGDAGSMFIGFMMSLLSITSISRETTMLSVIVPICVMFVPILDIFLSIVRRCVMRRSPLKPDHLHFHHLLNEYFHNQLAVVIILSFIQMLFAAAGIFIFMNKAYILGWIFVGSITLISSIFTVIYALKKREDKEIKTV